MQLVARQLPGRIGALSGPHASNVVLTRACASKTLACDLAAVMRLTKGCVVLRAQDAPSELATVLVTSLPCFSQAEHAAVLVISLPRVCHSLLL